MAKSARCTDCDLYLPYDREICPGCGGKTWEFVGKDFDEDWPERVEEIKNRWRPGNPLPDINRGKIVKYKGNYFIADKLLRKFGYLDVDTDSIVLVGGKHYEVDGRIEDEESPGWWIKEVKPEEEFNDLPTLSVYEYDSLQKRRIRGYRPPPYES